MRAAILGNGEARIGPRLRRLLQEAVLIVCADVAISCRVVMGMMGGGRRLKVNLGVDSAKVRSMGIPLSGFASDTSTRAP